MSIGDLSRTLTEIAATDPSRNGHTGPDTPDVSAAYARRNALIWQAAAQAHAAGVPAGVSWDAGDPHPVVVYIELPDAGQVSWHLPAHLAPWDGHSTEVKYARVDRFTGAHGLGSLCHVDDCPRCAAVVADVAEQWRRDEEDALASVLADETAAAADPDPDFGKDGVW